MKHSYTVKQTSKITGIPADTLRFYDKKGILSPARKENRYRYYSEEDLIKLEYLSVMKYANFSLEEITIMLNLLEANPSEECKVKTIALLTSKRKELKSVVINLSEIIRLLDKVIDISENIEYFPEEKVRIDSFIHNVWGDISKDMEE